MNAQGNIGIQASSPRPSSELEIEATRLSESLCKLDNRMAELHSRLTPILSQEPKTGSGSDCAEASPCSPMGVELRNRAYHAEAMTQSLEQLLFRLAL